MAHFLVVVENLPTIEADHISVGLLMNVVQLLLNVIPRFASDRNHLLPFIFIVIFSSILRFI